MHLVCFFISYLNNNNIKKKKKRKRGNPITPLPHFHWEKNITAAPLLSATSRLPLARSLDRFGSLGAPGGPAAVGPREARGAVHVQLRASRHRSAPSGAPGDFGGKRSTQVELEATQKQTEGRMFCLGPMKHQTSFSQVCQHGGCSPPKHSKSAYGGAMFGCQIPNTSRPGLLCIWACRI